VTATDPAQARQAGQIATELRAATMAATAADQRAAAALEGGGPPISDDPFTQDLLKKYRVPVDPGGMVEFHGNMITKTGKDMVDALWPWAQYSFKGIHDDALKEPQGRLGGQGIADGPAASWRPAYWTARLSRKFGDDWTARYTSAHEGVPNPD